MRNLSLKPVTSKNRRAAEKLEVFPHQTEFTGCRKTPQKTDVTEQRGVCAGGKKPTARSIKQDFETFLKVSKSAQRGEKTFSTRCLSKVLRNV